MFRSINKNIIKVLLVVIASISIVSLFSGSANAITGSQTYDQTANIFTDIFNNRVEAQEAPAEEPAGDGALCQELGFVLGWVICPVGQGLAEILDNVDALLYNLLYIDTSEWDTSGVQGAWEGIRTVASALIVVVLLVGIASQIFSFDFVSAYTIRKVLPKIIIATIGIWLSFFIASTLVDISNTIGFSIQSIIQAPFLDTNNVDSDPKDGWISFREVIQLYGQNNSGSENGAGGAVVGVGAAGILFGAGTLAALIATGAGPSGILLFLVALLLPAVIAVLFSFVIIVLRVILIVGLTIMMPLALVAWVLPNTSKWFDRWWEVFFSLLAFFPIVIGFLGLGKVMAVIAASTPPQNGASSIITLTVVIVAYFIPYFLMFKLIKFSSGSLGKLQGGLDSLNKKVGESGPIKNVRENARKSTLEAKKENALRPPKTKFGRAWNTATLGTARRRNTLGTLGTFGSTARRARDAEAGQDLKNAEEELTSIASTLTAPQKKALYEGMLYGKEGGKYVKDENGNNVFKTGEDILKDAGINANISDRLRAAAINPGIGYKLNDAVEQVFKDSASSSGSYLSSMVNRSAEKYGPTIDERMPNITRGGTVIARDDSGAIDQSKIFGSVFEKALTGMDKRDLDSSISKDVRQAIVMGLKSSDASTRALATSYLTAYAHNDDTGQAGMEKMMRILQSEGVQLDNGDLMDVFDSAKQKQVRINPSTQRFEVISTSEVIGTSATPVSPNPSGITRQSAAAMSPQNASDYIKRQGGPTMVNEADLLRIANEHGREEAGQAAKAELRRRGILSDKSDRNLP